MKLSRGIILLCMTQVFLLQGCSLFGGDDQQQEEIQPSEEGEEAEQDEQGNQEENQENSQQENLENIDASMNAANEAMAEMANAEMGSEALGTLPETEMPDASDLTEGGGIEDLNSIMNSMNTDQGAEPQFETMPAMDAPPAVSSGTPGGTRVYYVLPGGGSLKDSPGGGSVKSLPQGEPCLVTIEGEWANIINRGYMKVSKLTEKPIGRVRGKINWN